MDEEDLLLDSGTSIDIGNLSDLNEAAILDDDNDNGGEGAKESSPVHCEVEDLEELDYDEDIEEEKAPRSGKFTSERALIRKESLTSNEPRGVNISSTDSVTKGTISHTSTEPENKSLEPKSISRTAIPSSPQNLSVAKPQAAKAKSSLLSSIAKNTQPSNAPKANRQQQSARTPAKMLINPHYKGILQPKNKLLANWNPPVAPRPGLASSLSVLPIPSSMPCSMPVPMQASGVSCIGLPTLPAITRPVPYDMNISSSILFPRPASSLPPLMSFNAPPPASMYHYSAPPPVAPAISSNGQWDKMVEGFLRRTSAHNRSPRRYSSASKSSSSSSRSSSRSYYSGSSFTSNSSRSSSISPHRSERRYRRERRHSSSPRHVDEKRPRNGRGGRVRYGDEHTDIEHFRTSQRPRASEETTRECAKAIGLDNEYLTKLEEQKKMREQLLREKEAKRYENMRRTAMTEALNSQSKNDQSIENRKSLINVRRDRKRVRDRRTAGDSVRTVRNYDRLQSERLAERRITRRERGNEVDCEAGNPRRRTEQTRITLESGDGLLSVSASKSRKTVSVECGREPPCRMENTTKRSVVMGGSRTKSRVSESQRQLPQTPLTAARKGQIVSAQNSAQSYVHTQLQQQQQQLSKTPSQQVQKKKAYLAVVVKQGGMRPDVDRLQLIAATIGPTKKVWISSESSVSLIFEAHESAKRFLLEYNGKLINGSRLNITLEKVFANLSQL